MVVVRIGWGFVCILSKPREGKDEYRESSFGAQPTQSRLAGKAKVVFVACPICCFRTMPLVATASEYPMRSFPLPLIQASQMMHHGTNELSFEPQTNQLHPGEACVPLDHFTRPGENQTSFQDLNAMKTQSTNANESKGAGVERRNP